MKPEEVARQKIDELLEWSGWAVQDFKDLNPDFQRAHVCTEEQQSKYVEFILRSGQSGRDIHFNCKGWMRQFDGVLVIVDGKQRLNAVLSFLSDKIPAFGRLLSGYEDKLPFDASFNFHINDLSTRKDILQWYLDLNEGGVVHTAEELEKVKMLLAREYL
jgi:hypothetical protein